MKCARGIGRAGLWAGLALVLAAGAPLTSPRPVPRPELTTLLPPDHPALRAQAAGLDAVLADILRGDISVSATGNITTAIAGVTASPLPVARPATAARTSPPLVNTQRDVRAPRRGSVCGVRQIRGEPIPAIPGRLRGCGVTRPVRVTEVSGVRLSQPADIDCATAKALNDWVRRGVKPAIRRRGGGVAELRVIVSYACRTRNSQPGAKISEHGRGKALDISGFTLRNGDFLSVKDDWGRGRAGRILRRIHDAACGPFGTVLGPDANRFHRDHFHVDTASYRGGPYCR